MSVLYIYNANAQSVSVSINDAVASPNSHSILDVDVSTNDKGILIPRLTSTERTNISGLSSTEEGLTVYDETTSSYWYWNGTTWINMDSDWKLTGNSASTSNFIGTTNSNPLNFKVNNTTAGKLATDNTFFGYQSGLNMTTSGTQNVFVGESAGKQMSSGNSNVALGSNALYNYGNSSTFGNGNVAIGKYAMFYYPTGGENNVAVGRSAYSLPHSGGGSENVFVGHSSDAGNTSPSNVVAVGASSKVIADNATAIGYRAYANVANTLILGQVNGVNGATENTNVGIGTTTPSERLEVNGNIMINSGVSDGARLIWRGGSGGTQEYRARVFTDGRLSFFPIEIGQPGYLGEVLSLTQSGNVGIGDVNPSSKLVVNGEIKTSNDVNGYLTLGRCDNSSEGGQINWTGAGSYASWYQDLAANNMRIFSTVSSANALQIFGTTTNVNIELDGNYNSYSDSRIKLNQRDLNYGLKTIMQIKAKRYDKHNSTFIDGKLVLSNDNYINSFGFIAQELYKIVPEIVSKPKDENSALWSVSYGKLTPILVKAIQEQQQQIEQQQQQIDEQQKTIDKLIKQNQEILNQLKNK